LIQFKVTGQTISARFHIYDALITIKTTKNCNKA